MTELALTISRNWQAIGVQLFHRADRHECHHECNKQEQQVTLSRLGKLQQQVGKFRKATNPRANPAASPEPACAVPPA
jgi:hypothetical protein